MSISKEPPRTFTLEARVDIRDFATFARFLEKNGVQVRSKSQVVAEALAFVSSVLEQNGKAQRFVSSEDARNFLNELELTGQSRQKTLLNLARQIELETSVGIEIQQAAEPTTDELVLQALREME